MKPRSALTEFERDEARRLDMLHAADTIRGYLRAVTRAKFTGMVLDAVLRQLGIFGEAAAEFSGASRRQYPDIPWGSVVRQRQYVIHQYFDVDLDEAWDAAAHTVPEYARMLRARSLKRSSAQLEAEVMRALKNAKKNKRQSKK
jgi:uncharacterized protein with HEPN domain